MDIKTNFDVGDDVWVLHSGKFKNVKIKKVWIIKSNKTFVTYGYRIEKDCGCLDTVDERECFATKEELITYIHDTETGR